jgi:hypothetical protein
MKPTWTIRSVPHGPGDGVAKRRVSAGHLRLTPARALALTIGPMPTLPGEVPALDDELLEALYWRHRDRLLEDCAPGTRPWAFWMFEPRIPPHLRAQRPQLVAVEAVDGEIDAQRTRLDRERRAWLADGVAAPA